MSIEPRPNYDSVLEFLRKAKDANEDQLPVLIKAYADAFAYQGFDPKRIMDKMSEACRQRQLNYKDQVALAISIIVHRGTKMKKVLERASDELKAAATGLSQILTTKAGTALGRDDITLPRIAACYPAITATTVAKVGKVVLSGYKDVHPLLQSHSFAAVCPSDPAWANAARVNLAWIIEFDRFVRPRSPTDPMKQAQFWRASHASPILSNEDRYKLMKKLELKAGSVNDFINKDGAAKVALVPPFEMAPPVLSSLVYSEHQSFLAPGAVVPSGTATDAAGSSGSKQS